MNKTTIKNYAIWARVQLIESAKQRAYEYEITENGENNPNLETISGRLLSKVEKEQRQQLIAQIRQKGYAQVMEEAAYTWFNRFIALRFMEVNGYLPSKVRVFTDENNAFKPEILKEAMSIDLEGLDRSLILEMLDRQDNEALFKYLLIIQCNALSAGLPYMFEKIANWTELLFPANLLRQDSVIDTMISTIPEEDWTDAVQIIGWLYQYYNSELKDETFALLKKNVKITKERIPAATQLFTPEWIVRYMVENSLGRLWYEGHRDFDKSAWKYYLDEAEQEPEVEQQLAVIRAEYAKMKPEEIRVIDPCMGSGHILVYAFDVLMQIYTAAGWSERDAAKSIIENNLYGLDIDDRAGQLAYFAIMMKARKYNRRILNGEARPNVLSIQDSNWMTDEFIAYVAGKDMTMKADLVMLRKAFRDSKEFGSILTVPIMQYDTVYTRIEIIRGSAAEDLFQIQYQQQAIEQLLPLIRQSQYLSQKYDVALTNPPYMGSSGMSDRLSQFVKDNYPDSKSDLFAVFMERIQAMLKRGAYQAMITQHAWMFLASFERLRTGLLNIDTINMIHLGSRAFEEIAGEVVQTTSFVFRNSHVAQYKGKYCRLTEPTTQQGKEELFISGEKQYVAKEDNFSKIPGAPIAYWARKELISIFENSPRLGDGFIDARIGMVSGDNDRFLRLWHEVVFSGIEFEAEAGFDPSIKRWYPLQKGGDYRLWYGNLEYVIDWEKDGDRLKHDNYAGSRVRSHNYNGVQQFKAGITWNSIATSRFHCRYSPEGFTFDAAGPLCEVKKKDNLYYILGMLSSKASIFMFNMINPTINFPSGYLESLPIVFREKESVDSIVSDCVLTSRKDWDSFETSWDFQRHPLVAPAIERHYMRLSDCWKEWKCACDERFNKLKANEEELNRIFINIYGLQDELTPEVDDKDVTVRRADLGRDIRSLISYAVGCMLGRYSLDKPALAFAGGAWDASEYKTYIPDADGILPITDDEYFDDDVVGMFVYWVRTVYGKEPLEENLKFIANALGGKGTPREVIRNYFLNDFYADHLKVFQKRPIYWLFSSGKKNGFKCLIYMHRYQPDLLARIRTDYVHEQQERYRTQLQMAEDSLQTAAPTERVKLNKRITKLKDQALELQKYEEKIHHLADQMIPIDLDDGVKVNYAKFEDVLEKIK